MEPSRAPQSGSRFFIFVIFGVAIILAALLMLAFGGLFWSWVVSGVIVLAAGLLLVVHLARKNRSAV